MGDKVKRDEYMRMVMTVYCSTNITRKDIIKTYQITASMFNTYYNMLNGDQKYQARNLRYINTKKY